MQRRVLNYLYNQGELTFFAFPGEAPDDEALEKFALAQNAGARFILLDFTGREGDTGISLAELFVSHLAEDRLALFDDPERKRFVFGGFEKPTDSEEAFRTFYYNLQLLKNKVAHIVALLPGDEPRTGNSHVLSIAKAVVIAGSNAKEASIYVEDSPALQTKPILWLIKEKPVKKIYPKCYRAFKRGYSGYREFRKFDWKRDTEKFAKAYATLCKAEILRKNPLDGLPKQFVRFFPLFLIAVIAIPFAIPNKVEMDVSNMRDRTTEMNNLSAAPSFTYTFDGNETMQRIARYAIGRFNAVITTDRMVKQYIDETMEENGYKYKQWEKNNLIYPPAGTIVKFSRPENLSRATADSIGAAWKYWTSIVSDSVAYLTEFYHEYATANQRQHNGIDVASRQGARILAPFAAKAWTSRDERGGIIIGLVREKDVIIFMHCDQLLYLDGQEVMPGDPIATVGTTGHTTGPHAHIVTGLIDKRGTKRIGNVKYKVIDPISWFYKFKPSLP